MSTGEITLPVDILEEEGITLAYLFGSQVYGETSPLSDVDLGLVFATPPADPRRSIDAYVRLSEKLTPLVKPYPLDLVFLQQTSVELQHEVIAQGRLLYAANDEARGDFEYDVLTRYLDYKPDLDAFYEEVLSAVEEGDFYGQS